MMGCSGLGFYYDWVYIAEQTAVIWTRERESEERCLGTLTEVQLCDPTHIHGGHQASGGEYRRAS